MKKDQQPLKVSISQPQILNKYSSVGTQTEVIQRDFISAKVLSSFYRESDGFPAFFYKSHTITQLISFTLVLYLFTFYFEGTSMAQSAQRGFLMACFSLIVFGTIFFPNSLLQRPHPALWRMLQAWGCCYLMSVIFALFMSPVQLQEFLNKFIDPNLGQPLQEKSYAADCRFFTPDHPTSYFANIVGAMDVFVAGHICGWMLKMFVLRDFKLAMIQQIMFELMELTFRHWLPNFHECWWDHIILDIIICNTGGILISSFLMKKYGMKEYKWSLRSQEQNSGFWMNVKSLIINPNLDRHEWKVFSSTKRFLSVVWFIIFMNLIDLSYFFNKYVLWIEPNHTIMKLRIFGLGFLCIAAAREYYTYISDSNVKRLGPSAWLVTMITISEWLLFAKNYDGSFTQEFPLHVKLFWGLIGFVFFTILSILIIKDVRKSQNKVKDQ